MSVDIKLFEIFIGVADVFVFCIVFDKIKSPILKGGNSGFSGVVAHETRKKNISKVIAIYFFCIDLIPYWVLADVMAKIILIIE